VDFEKPKLQEILDAVQTVPGLRPLLLRTELQPILRNLMVLDWVLREDIAQRFSASGPWIGEAELIDSIWDRWVGPGSMNLARDSLLRTLGQRESVAVYSAVAKGDTHSFFRPENNTGGDSGAIIRHVFLRR